MVWRDIATLMYVAAKKEPVEKSIERLKPLIERKYLTSIRFDDSLMASDGKVYVDVDLTKIDSPFSVFSYERRMDPEIFDYIDGDFTPFEKAPLSNLVRDKGLVGYIHKGYWQCMDTLREKQQIEKLWDSGKAPWKVWES